MPSVTCCERLVELVPLVGHLGQAHVRGAGGGPRAAAAAARRLQRLPAGPDRGVQPALGALDLAEADGSPRP